VDKTEYQKAWFMVLPVLVLVAFTAIIPLMTVVNYSIQDILGRSAFFVGGDWFRETLQNPQLQAALGRQFFFSFTILAIQVPLGIGIALLMPKKGWQASAVLILIAMPLLIPWNVVGSIWQIFTRGDIGLAGYTLNNVLGVSYNITRSSLDAWVTIILMDVWHWTPLIALLCYSGLRAIPEAYYQAARIDRASRWAIFRYIELPKLTNVLVIGVLLRFMHSFMIYAEPFVLTGGGPGSSTTFLSQTLTTMAVAQQDLGPSAAFSIIYFLIVLAVSYVFYVTIMNMQKERLADVGGGK